MFQRLADGLFAIAGAASFSQFPEYFRQYLQRLGGRLDQALVEQDRITAAARQNGLTVDAYVRRLMQNADAVARSEGQNVAASLADADRLRGSYEALSSAAPWERPAVLAQHFDENLARAAFDQFVPAVPLSPEGLLYALIGMILALMLLAGGQRTGRAVVRKVRGDTTTSAET